MTPRRRRMVLVGLILLGVGAAVAFALTAFQDNLLYFYPPSRRGGGQGAGGSRVPRSAAWCRRAASSADRQPGSALRRHRFRSTT